MEEIWRLNADFSGVEISNMGNFRTPLMGSKLHPRRVHKACYLTWYDPSLGKPRTVAAHILVAETFVKKEEGKPYVHHRNGIRTDNRASNLYWSSKRRVGNYSTQNAEKTMREYDFEMKPIKSLNDEGAIELWKAINQLAVEDIAIGIKSAKDEDAQNAEDAKRFFQHSIQYFMGDLDMNSVQKSVARRVVEALQPKKPKPKPKKQRPPKWKKERCAKCKYRMIINGVWPSEPFSCNNIACGYILHTGHRRPCRGENCTVYEKGNPGKEIGNRPF